MSTIRPRRTNPKARPDFEQTLARAGIERSALAAAADVSIQTIHSLANPSSYNRAGGTRSITAWKVARGFAKLTGQPEDAAYAALFAVNNESNGINGPRPEGTSDNE